VIQFKEKLVRRLKFKCKELSEELKSTNKTYGLITPEFESAFNLFCSSNNLENPLDKEIKKKPKEKKSIPEDLKSLYREIAIKTHPDKTSNDDSGEILIKASIAKKDNNTTELMSIAKDLKIDTSKIDFESIEAIEENIKKIEKEIELKTNSFPWVWFFSGKKEKFLKMFYYSLSVS